MRVSVIIPTLNEEGCLAETLRSVRAQRPHQVIGGVLAERCSAVLTDFFAAKRRQGKG